MENKEEFAEPFRAYVRRKYGTQAKFALAENFTERAVSLMRSRGDVVINGVRYVPAGKLEGGL
ncbi:MAG: hypothetical protein ACRDDY_13180 [Clostridium sp.]|uniref:hypothetical protein n=1 Tax=Clostridium sp. TaxID=1506 RepID=UPI003EE4333E